MRTTYLKDRTDDVLEQLPGLRRYARTLTRDVDCAEDLVQDALLSAYERRSTFRHCGNLKGWLFSILHNTFIDGRRRQAAEARRDAEVIQLAETTLPAGQEARVRLAQIQQAFFMLPDEQRAVLHLVAVEGMSYQEASTALGIPLGTLMSRLGRARAALRSFEEVSARTPSLPAPKSSRKPSLRVVGGDDD